MSATKLHMTPRPSGSSLPEIAKQPRDGALQAGASTIALALASGFRADLGLGDDFFGSREDAYSETVRQKRWDWYLDDFSARLKPGGKCILMNTRWHEEDVAGRVLEQD